MNKVLQSCNFKTFIKCPTCRRKLAATGLHFGVGNDKEEVLQIVHKGFTVITKAALIKCLSCDKYYAVMAGTKEVVEIQIEEADRGNDVRRAEASTNI